MLVKVANIWCEEKPLWCGEILLASKLHVNVLFFMCSCLSVSTVQISALDTIFEEI